MAVSQYSNCVRVRVFTIKHNMIIASPIWYHIIEKLFQKNYKIFSTPFQSTWALIPHLVRTVSSIGETSSSISSSIFACPASRTNMFMKTKKQMKYCLVVQCAWAYNKLPTWTGGDRQSDLLVLARQFVVPAANKHANTVNPLCRSIHSIFAGIWLSISTREI